jgi:hypothetical protein
MATRKKPVPPPPLVDARQRYDIPEGSAILRQSQAATFKDMARPDDDPRKLRVIREGGRTFIPGSELIRRSTLPEQTATA